MDAPVQVDKHSLKEFTHHLSNLLDQLEAKYAGNPSVHEKVLHFKAVVSLNGSILGKYSGLTPAYVCHKVIEAMYPVRHEICQRNETYFLQEIKLNRTATSEDVELFALVREVWKSPETTEDTKKAVWAFLHVILASGCVAMHQVVDFAVPHGHHHKHPRHQSNKRSGHRARK
jgi:hypothetical protein